MTSPFQEPLALRALEALGLPDGLAYAALTPDLRVEQASAAFCDFCGGKNLGRTKPLLSEVMPEVAGIEDALTGVLRGEAPTFEIRRIMREHPGQPLTYASLLAVPRTAKRPGDGLLVIVQDTTEIGTLEQKLSQQRNDIAVIQRELINTADVLRQRNQELDSFSYTVAHDLKTPLSVINGYVGIVRADLAGSIGERAKKALGQIEATVYMMSSIIHSLLLFAHLRDTSEVTTKVDMAPVVKHSLERLASKIEERGVRIEVAPELPPVLGYGPWIEEVIANLVENAIKYIGADNHDPQITIVVRRSGDTLAYGVRDNGIGITPENKATLFDMFTRFDADQSDGFGLGLAIVARIVHKLRGEVEVESEVGRGSTFWVKLPAVEP